MGIHVWVVLNQTHLINFRKYQPWNRSILASLLGIKMTSQKKRVYNNYKIICCFNPCINLQTEDGPVIGN